MISTINNELQQLNQIINLKDTYSKKEQKRLIKSISKYPLGLMYLLKLLIQRQSKDKNTLSHIDGTIFKNLYNSRIINLEKELNTYFKKGIVNLESSQNINYMPLYKSLISNNFKTANQLTQTYLNKLAGLNKEDKRKWLYFTDVLNFPIKDLKTIDSLWRIYSEDQFGFSIQRQIWIYNNQNWEKFWHQIGWKIDNKNIRYPNEFIWNQKAPTGHLPLFNQLRGVQVLATLFMHPAWRMDKNE